VIYILGTVLFEQYPILMAIDANAIMRDSAAVIGARVQGFAALP
jgi:hypothetical protein